MSSHGSHRRNGGVLPSCWRAFRGAVAATLRPTDAGFRSPAFRFTLLPAAAKADPQKTYKKKQHAAWLWNDDDVTRRCEAANVPKEAG